MITRHLHELLSRLERVGDYGCAEIRWAELPYWYNQERTTVNIWRDVQTKWEELLQTWGGDEIPLLVGEAAGCWVFVWGEGLETSSKSWLKDVRDLGKMRRDEAA